MSLDMTIERGRGMTYSNDRWTVYEHGTYPDGSVLAGQDYRGWVEDFETLEEAVKAYPDAQVLEGTTYQPPCLSHLPEGHE